MTQPQWKINEQAKLTRMIEHETFYRDGALWWISNNSPVPPSTFRDAGIEDDMPENQRAVYDRETSAFIAEYKARQPSKPSAEERFEMLAAFGPGEEIVNIVTGRTYRT